MTDQQTSKRRGCFFYGCLTAVILFVVVAAGFYFAARYAINTLNKFTQTSPMPLPKVEMAADELSRLRERVDTFKRAVAAQTASEPLELSERDINGLILNDPDFKELRDKVYVSLQGEQIKGQVSIPLDNLGPKRLQGRYLNGEATLNVSLQNGVLIVTMQSLRVGSEDVPAQFMEAIRKENLAKDVYRDARTAEAISKLESIEVKDGKLIIEGRANE